MLKLFSILRQQNSVRTQTWLAVHLRKLKSHATPTEHKHQELRPQAHGVRRVRCQVSRVALADGTSLVRKKLGYRRAPRWHAAGVNRASPAHGSPPNCAGTGHANVSKS